MSATAPSDRDDRRMPYQLPMPKEASADLVIPSVLPADERLWVPQAPNVWFRPLCLNASQGYWVNLLKVTKAGVLSRHRHTNPVHGYVIKGRWHYAERDWIAEEGGYVFEAPGDIHTLMGMGDSETLFWITGTLVELDENGKSTGYADVFTRIEQAAAHFKAVGLGGDYVRKFIR